MAKSTVILTDNKRVSKVVKTLDTFSSEIFDDAQFDSTVLPIDDNRVSRVVEECYTFLSKVIYNPTLKSLVIDEVPFKIRIQNITVPGYSPTNVPPIGIAIIGFNNYIL